ncbi:MAG: response regulator transcription factor [Clostridia bacterium]|nr:response regulator transcription factor [Clostridia bacterium]
MIHMVICDDEQQARTALQASVTRWMSENGHWDVSLRVCSSSEEVWELYENGLPMDLLLLDIQIPGELDGMSLARKIRAKDPNMAIVFITNYADYVYDGYTVAALRYLRKPVQDSELFECLHTAYRQNMLLRQESLLLDVHLQRQVIRYSDIFYLESRMHRVEFHTSHSPEPISVRARLEDYRAQLPSALFVQCHRSYIVNIARICRLSSTAAVLSNGDTIPVSKTWRSDLRAALERYYLKGDD